MKIIGSKLLGVIKLKKTSILVFYISFLFSQLSISSILHPLDNSFSDLKKQDYEYILFQSESFIEIPGILNQHSHSALYHTSLNDYKIRLSYIDMFTELLSDTLSSPLNISFKRNYQLYKLDIEKKYNKWKIGVGYSLSKSKDLFHNYNFFINRRVARYFRIEYKYSVKTNPEAYSLDYDNFNYSDINSKNNEFSDISLSFKRSKIKSRFKYRQSIYLNKVDKDFDSFEGGRFNIYYDLGIDVNKKINMFFQYSHSLDTMALDLINNESIFYKINILKLRNKSSLIRCDYKLDHSKIYFGYSQNNYAYELSSRINAQDISNNLLEKFTVPIINGLDTIKISQSNLFVFYEKKFNHNKYKIGMNYSENNIYYFHRVATPPLNPLVPIYILKEDDYVAKAINIMINYSFKINKLNIDIALDNAIPISINNSDGNQADVVLQDIPHLSRLIMFNNINLRVQYNLK